MLGLLETAKLILASYPVVSAAKFMFEESAKVYISESVKKLFERKPKVRQALEKVRQLPENTSDENKINELSQSLQILIKEDAELKGELEKWLKHIEKVNQAAKEGRTINADNYFETVHVQTMNFDQRKS
ncbi:MAG: hypothetical protein AAF740_04435 [Bacteroidota bacterium]